MPRLDDPRVPHPVAESENAGARIYDDIGCSLTSRSWAGPRSVIPSRIGHARRLHGPALWRSRGGRSGSLGAGDWARSRRGIGFARARRIGFARRGKLGSSERPGPTSTCIQASAGTFMGWGDPSEGHDCSPASGIGFALAAGLAAGSSACDGGFPRDGLRATRGLPSGRAGPGPMRRTKPTLALRSPPCGFVRPGARRRDPDQARDPGSGRVSLGRQDWLCLGLPWDWLCSWRRGIGSCSATEATVVSGAGRAHRDPGSGDRGQDPGPHPRRPAQASEE